MSFQLATMNDPDMLPGQTMAELTVVIPVYRNETTLKALHHRLCRVLADQATSSEILFVNDASPDDSLTVLNELADCHSNVLILSLEQNVGQHGAVMAGLARAHSRSVIVMDADLQDPPEAIPLLLAALEEGYAGVFAGRRGRYESYPRLLTGRFYKWAIHVLCGIPRDAGMFFAADRNMVERLLAFETSRPYVTSMMGCTGLPLISVPVSRDPRRNGQSAIDWRKRIQIGTRGIIWTLMWRYRRS